MHGVRKTDKTFSDIFEGIEVNQHIAYEWLDDKEEERAVVVRIKPRCDIEVDSCTGRRLRMVKLIDQESVYIMTSSNKGRTYTCIKVPKEYDLVKDTCYIRQ